MICYNAIRSRKTENKIRTQLRLKKFFQKNSKKLKKGIDKQRKMCYDIKAVRSGSEGKRKKHLEN